MIRISFLKCMGGMFEKPNLKRVRVSQIPLKYFFYSSIKIEEDNIKQITKPQVIIGIMNNKQ